MWVMYDYKTAHDVGNLINIYQQLSILITTAWKQRCESLIKLAYLSIWAKVKRRLGPDAFVGIRANYEIMKSIPYSMRTNKFWDCGKCNLKMRIGKYCSRT